MAISVCEIHLGATGQLDGGPVDVGARLACDTLGVLLVYLWDADEVELLGDRGHYEAIAFMPSYGEVGFGVEERWSPLRPGDCVRVVSGGPQEAVANDHSQFLLFSAPAAPDAAETLVHAHISTIPGAVGWTRPIGAHLGATSARLDWLALPPRRTLTANGAARAEEVYVVLAGAGELRAGTETIPLVKGTTLRRDHGDPPFALVAEEQLELLAFGTAIPAARPAA